MGSFSPPFFFPPFFLRVLLLNKFSLNYFFLADIYLVGCRVRRRTTRTHAFMVCASMNEIRLLQPVLSQTPAFDTGASTANTNKKTDHSPPLGTKRGLTIIPCEAWESGSRATSSYIIKIWSRPVPAPGLVSSSDFGWPSKCNGTSAPTQQERPESNFVCPGCPGPLSRSGSTHISFRTLGSTAAVAFSFAYLHLSSDGQLRVPCPGIIAMTCCLITHTPKVQCFSLQRNSIFLRSLQAFLTSRDSSDY